MATGAPIIHKDLNRYGRDYQSEPRIRRRVRSLPDNVEMTHVSLFDGTLEGIALRDRPVFSVQYHPEASRPQDSHYLFDRFIGLMESR